MVLNRFFIYQENSYGFSLRYSIEENTQKIRGRGEINDYIVESLAQWHSNNKLIKNIELPEALTSIGSYAFYEKELLLLNIYLKSYCLL